MNQEYKQKIDSLCRIIVSSSKFALSSGVEKEHVIQILTDNAIMACHFCGFTEDQCREHFNKEIDRVKRESSLAWGKK